MKRVQLIRHGPVHNPEKRIYGWSDIPLSEPAENIIDVISNETLDGFSILITSDLQRCLNAAEALADCSGLPILITDRLREQSFGDWEGMTWDEVKTQYPKEWKQFFQDWIHARPPYGESFIEVSQRVIRFREERNSQPENEIWITHAGPIRAIVSHINNISLINAFDIECPFYANYDLSFI